MTVNACYHLLPTASCFLTGWHVAWTTRQRAKHGCCLAVEHKSLLSSSRRRQANWCSAGVETKAAVMSLWGHGGLHGGMPPPAPHKPVSLPFLPLSTHSPPTTPLLTQWLRGNWNTECVWLHLRQRMILFPFWEALWSRPPMNSSLSTVSHQVSQNPLL